MQDHAGCTDRHKGPEDPLRPVQHEGTLAVLHLGDDLIQAIFKQYCGESYGKNGAEKQKHFSYLRRKTICQNSQINQLAIPAC